MTKTIQLDIPADAATRVRLRIIRGLLTDLTAHSLTMDQTTQALNDLIAAEVMQATGRTRAGNDIGGI